jgi:hypothetical protein
LYGIDDMNEDMAKNRWNWVLDRLRCWVYRRRWRGALAGAISFVRMKKIYAEVCVCVYFI